MDPIIPESEDRHVREIMTRNVIKVRPGASVGEIARLMSDHSISGLPVVDKEDAVLGVITELDMVLRNTHFKLPAFFTWLDATIYFESSQRMQQRLQRMLVVTAEEIMSQPAITIGEYASIEELAELMVDRRVNPIPVVDEGRLVGIVSRADIVRMMAKEA